MTTLRCPLCQRDVPKLLMERHHTKTKEVDRDATIPICNGCHKFIHALFTNKKVASELNTIDALLANERFANALKFIRKQSPTSKITVKKARLRK